MIENEDKCVKQFEKIINTENFYILEKYVLNFYINFKKLLKALLLEYIDFNQYEIHF
jgi:hypothetical protein